MICDRCNHDNAPEAKFCVECGTRLTLPDTPKLEVKPEEIDQLLADGYRLLHEKNFNEALYIADAVLSVDPEDTSALALKGLCHEGNDQLQQAIEVYEQIAILNPDSTLDRIKLSQLRRKAAEHEVEEDEVEVRSRKTVAIFSAVAAALVITATGVMLAIFSRPAQAVGGEETVAQNERASGFDLTPPSTQKQPEATDGPPETTTPDPLIPDARGTVPPVRFNPPPIIGNGGGLPPISFTASPESGQPGNALPNPGDARAGGGTAPNTDAGGDRRGPEPADERPPNRGKIEIKPSSQDVGAESENIYRVAQQKMQAGDYRGALKDFLASLPGSSHPALTHQLIGRCYKRLGQNESARTHFRTALELFEKAGQVAGAEACRRELQSVGG